jgi:predicted nucleic acid-binding protein
LTLVVVDASSIVDLLLDRPLAGQVRAALHGQVLAAPAHVDGEVLSAFGRLQRAGAVSSRRIPTLIDALVGMPIDRVPLPALLKGAWSRRHNLRISDALYAELASQQDATLVTCDAGLAQQSKGSILIR